MTSDTSFAGDFESRTEKTFDESVVVAVRKLRTWVRVAAIIGTAWAVIFLFSVVVGAGVATSARPDSRTAIIAVGTAYAVFALTLLCMAFVLARYGDRLGVAAAQQRVSPLVEATAYETAFWRIAAAFCAAAVLAAGASIATLMLQGTFVFSRAARTRDSIQTIARTLDRYAAEHHQYPNATSIVNLAAVLEPTYIVRLPRNDAWGRPFDYTATCPARCRDFRLSSPGADGRYQREPSSVRWDAPRHMRRPVHFGADFVFAEGLFVTMPRAIDDDE